MAYIDLSDYTSGSLRDLLRFEHLLPEVSARYINLPVDEIDGVATQKNSGRLPIQSTIRLVEKRG